MLTQDLDKVAPSGSMDLVSETVVSLAPLRIKMVERNLEVLSVIGNMVARSEAMTAPKFSWLRRTFRPWSCMRKIEMKNVTLREMVTGYRDKKRKASS